QVFGGDGFGVAVSQFTHDAGGAQVPDALLVSVPGGIFRSANGGFDFDRFVSGLAPLPFFVRLPRHAAADDVFLTYSAAPTTRFYRRGPGDAAWVNVSGVLHWQDSNQDTQGFVTVQGAANISLRNLAAHPGVPNTWAAVSNRFTYMTND